MNREEEHDELWQLLGKARHPEASPFFSRNVLRAIREVQQEPASWLHWVARRWKLATLGAAALVLVGAGIFHQTRQQQQIALIAQQVSDSPELYVIGHLDELMASAEDSVWLDSSLP